MAVIAMSLLCLLLTVLLGTTVYAQAITEMCLPCSCVSQNGQGLYKVNCRSNAMLKGSLPEFRNISDSQIQFLDMSNNNLYNLTSKTQTPFANYSSLQELILVNTSINSIENNSATIESTTFSGLQQLEILNIAHNEQFPVTNETDSNMFAHLTSMKKLIMYQINLIPINNTTGYPGPNLKNIPSLEEVWIDGFSVVPFGEEFQNMTNLKVIRISGDLITPTWQYPDFCAIQNISDNTLANLKHVTNLSILHCGVLNICENAFKEMQNLRMLDLSMNYGLGLDNPVSSFKSLNSGIEVLILDSLKNDTIECSIIIWKSMVESLEHTSLKMLSLDDNKISSIDKDAFPLIPKTLEHLRIRRNKFELGYYMLYVCQMTNLRRVEASFSQMGLQFAVWHDFDKLEYWPPSMSEYPNITLSGTANKHWNRFLVTDNHQSHVGNIKDLECPKPLLYVPTSFITAFLPPKLEYIDISHSKIGFPIFDFYIDSNNSVKTVNASNSLLFCWGGPVHGGKNVEIIDLSNNFCSTVKEDFFINFPKLKRVHLQRNYLYFVVEYKTIFHSNFELEFVDLSINRINNINPNMFSNQNKIKWIDLSANNLIGFDHRIFHMKLLNVLNLSENHIITLSKELRSDLDDIASSRNNETVTVDLINNFIACSCDNLEVLEWILVRTNPSSTLLTVQMSACYYMHNVSSVPPAPTVIRTKDDLMYQISFLKKFCALYTSLLIALVVALFVIFNIIFASVVHRFRWKIRYWYYVGYNKDNRCNSYTALGNSLRTSRFKYDIYLTYEEDAREFVLDTLKPKLLELDYIVFVHDDILEGLPLCNVITKSINASRVVVFVLSNGSRESLEWKIAAHMTNEESYHRGKPLSLAIFYDSDSTRGLPETLQLLRQDAFIDYPINGSEEEMAAFWEDFKTKVEAIDNATL